MNQILTFIPFLASPVLATFIKELGKTIRKLSHDYTSRHNAKLKYASNATNRQILKVAEDRPAVRVNGIDAYISNRRKKKGRV